MLSGSLLRGILVREESIQNGILVSRARRSIGGGDEALQSADVPSGASRCRRSSNRQLGREANFSHAGRTGGAGGNSLHQEFRSAVTDFVSWLRNSC